MNELAHDKRQLRSLHLFAGAGGGILADLLLGHRPVCAVEIEDYPRRVLLQRQRDGILPMFPIWDDVCTFDGRQWRGSVEIIAGGFPCQDISSAGKGAGIDGERSGLWSEMARIVGEVRPRFVFVENSPLLVSRGLDRVLSDLAEMGYDARWGIVGAHHAGAPHERERCWILADAYRSRQRTNKGKPQTSEARHNTRGRGEVLQHANSIACGRFAGLSGRLEAIGTFTLRAGIGDIWRDDPCEGQPFESCLGRVVDGVASELDRSRYKAIGNGQVPAVAALAWRLLGGPTA